MIPWYLRFKRYKLHFWPFLCFWSTKKPYKRSSSRFLFSTKISLSFFLTVIWSTCLAYLLLVQRTRFKSKITFLDVFSLLFALLSQLQSNHGRQTFIWAERTKLTVLLLTLESIRLCNRVLELLTDYNSSWLVGLAKFANNYKCPQEESINAHIFKTNARSEVNFRSLNVH